MRLRGGGAFFVRSLGQVCCSFKRACLSFLTLSREVGCLARKPALPDSLSLVHISPDTCADMPTAAVAAATIDLPVVFALKDVSLAATAFIQLSSSTPRLFRGCVPSAQMAIRRAPCGSKGCSACAKVVCARATRRAPSDMREEHAQVARATVVDSCSS